MTNYSHPKCYANFTSDCTKKISKEHIISDNILELFENHGKVKISGLSWIPYQIFSKVPRQRIVAKILCERHNNLLSPYDVEAGELFRCIKRFDADFNQTNPCFEHVKIRGHLFENWMLKVACGLIASNQIISEGQPKTAVMKEEFIDFLFKGAEMSGGWGLYFKVPDSGEIHKYDHISWQPITGNNEVKAMRFFINNFQFHLLLGKPSDSSYWGIHRINKINFRKGEVIKTIEFEWSDISCTAEVTLERVSTSKEHPSEWEDWMKS